MHKLLEKIKWSIFYTLNYLNNLTTEHSNNTVENHIYNYSAAAEYLWVFCSTIGELNACRPFIDYLNTKPQQLVLLTDRDCYKESYLKHYPDAIVVELTGEINDRKYLCKKLQPSLLVVCEIPCALHDAPCRFSYSLLRAVKNANKPAYLINGWLYGYEPSSRMDTIEKALFDRDYIASFDKITVQTKHVRDSLVAKGADPGKISVTGNMKFDSIINERPDTHDAITTEIVDSLINIDNPVFVAGCISDLSEFSQLLGLLNNLKNRHRDLIAVFAPRHPENQELMKNINSMLDDSGLSYRYKSRMESPDIKDTDLIILDTIGELKAFFYSGDICYMGQNHNILEPLSFGKPVFTINGWESTYPSYPVYQIAAEKELIYCCEGYAEMGGLMSQILNNHLFNKSNNIAQHMKEMEGAINRSLSFIFNDHNNRDFISE